MDLEGCLNEVNRLYIYTLLYMALTHLLRNPVDYYVSVESESAFYFFFFPGLFSVDASPIDRFHSEEKYAGLNRGGFPSSWGLVVYKESGIP